MLENLSQKYGLASRAMSLVAVVERKGDRPGELPKTSVVPVGMPQDVDFGAYFAIMGPQPHLVSGAMNLSVLPDIGAVMHEDSTLIAHKTLQAKYIPSIRGVEDKLERLVSRSKKHEELEEDASELIALAAQIEPDGGMPGKTDEERALASIWALLRFLAEGHTLRSGTFRKHVERLVKFLEDGKIQNNIVGAVVELAHAGKALEGDWSMRSPEPALWDELKSALKL
jgi:hypothetical protein